MNDSKIVSAVVGVLSDKLLTLREQKGRPHVATVEFLVAFKMAFITMESKQQKDQLAMFVANYVSMVEKELRLDITSILDEVDSIVDDVIKSMPV